MKLRPFELVLIVVFGTLFILALVLLRTYTPPADENTSSIGAGVSIWGTLPADVFESVLGKNRETDKAFSGVTYRYIPPENFDQVFIDALADQKAPDLIFMAHESLVKHRNRLQPIPYESFPIRDFRSTYIDGAEIFALSDGIYGLPMGVDPLVMYWNRDLFSTQNLINPPVTWEELVNEVVPALTVRDFNRNIERASVAMGEYQNIKNSLPLFSALLLQGGSAMVTESDSQYVVRLDESLSNPSAKPFVSAATFFTNFSNVSNTLYSWNRSLPLDREMFLSEDLAIYFGLGSEGRILASKNPNLNFDVAEVPQGATATVKRTYGLYYSLVMPKTATNPKGAFAVMQILGDESNAKQLTDGYNFAPARRSLLGQGSNDVYGRVTYLSAPNSRGWLNPATNNLSEVLSKMLEDISSNRSSIDVATGDTVMRLRQIY